MIKVKRVWLNRAEGPTKLVGQKKVPSIEDANDVLKDWATTAPKEGKGYHKVDFKVYWEDGEAYEGRYDLTQEDSWRANLGKQIRDFMSFHGGLKKPVQMDDETYNRTLLMIENRSKIPREQYVEFLKDYETS